MTLRLLPSTIDSWPDPACTQLLLKNLVDCVSELQTNNDYMVTQLTAMRALVNQERAASLYACLGNPGFAISTNFDVKNANAISYINGGTVKTLGANTNFDTGTTKTCTGSKYQAAVLSVDASGTGIVTWAPTAVYNSEAAAIAALTGPGAATETVLGYFTIQAHASGFTAGTDALTTGSGGNVCTATTYYNSINPNTLQIAAALSGTLPAATAQTGITVNKG